MAGRHRAIIHIGTPKTGTTSIQLFLSERRDALRERGFHYASAPGNRNHIALAAYGGGEGYTGNAVRRAGGGGGDGASIGPRLQQAIAAELADLPEHVHTVLYSSEQLATRLEGPADVARLKALLDPYFASYRIVVYLRRQDEVAVSKYSTSLRAGGESDPAILPPPGREGLLYHLADIVEGWAAVFGADAMLPRRFERTALLDGDVIADFLATVRIQGLPPAVAEPSRNPALNAETQEFVRRFNALVEARALPNRPRLGPFLRSERFQGKPRLPTRAEASAFYDRFRVENERLRAAYFPDAAALFAEDFSRYPEDAASGPVSLPATEQVLDVAMEVVLLVSEALRRSEVEVMAHDARAAASPAEARRRWSKVLHVERDHREALRAIARLDGVPAPGEPAGRTGMAERRDPDERAARRAARAAARAGRATPS